LSSADQARGLAAFNGTLVEFCRAHRVECIDLASVLPKDASIHYGVLSAGLREYRLTGRYAPESLDLNREDGSWDEDRDPLFLLG